MLERQILQAHYNVWWSASYFEDIRIHLSIEYLWYIF